MAEMRLPDFVLLLSNSVLLGYIFHGLGGLPTGVDMPFVPSNWQEILACMSVWFKRPN